MRGSIAARTGLFGIQTRRMSRASNGPSSLPRRSSRISKTRIGSAVKIVGVSDDLDLVARCEKDCPGSARRQRRAAARSQPYYLDVTHPQANKGAVVTTLSKLLNIPASEIATIGDMPNDVLMFRKSGFSIAMGNASDEVKAQASAVTDSNEDEGFAKAIRKFILRRAAA